MLWKTLVQWWHTRHPLETLEQAQRRLYSRLLQDALPALIPEVYLHNHPRTLREQGGDAVLPRQRMDFLLFLDHQVRIVIEIDGSHHYPEGGRAAPAKYAQMVEEDRRLRLTGYELYRFGGAEFADTTPGTHDRD